MAGSWGRIPKTAEEVRPLAWTSDPLPLPAGEARPVLPYGLGRSYGDSCLNDGGVLLATPPLDRLLAFDETRGVLRCEAGVTLRDILHVFVPRGWFPPVTPGTKFVTVGGAIANDIHGKNHHVAGSFGNHVLRFELLRSDGTRRVCSPTENADWFHATIGGLGLTGLITWAEIQMAPVANAYVDMESIRFRDLDGFFDLSEASKTVPYSVSWVDCLARGAHLGRGYFVRGDHARAPPPGLRLAPRDERLPFPFDAPGFALNKLTVRAFNAVYYRRQARDHVRRIVHYDPFFYPLDSIANWNRMYGKRGFYQYQCVVPGRDEIRRLLDAISEAREGTFLAVLKTFGGIPSVGTLSFPTKGVTLALDFANKGDRTLRLLDRLDAIVRDAGGRVYPAKDARMSPESFRAYYPGWKDFARFVDPRFSSSFWRRVTA